MAPTSRMVWEPPTQVGGAREWRGWVGDRLVAHIDVSTDGYADEPYRARLRLEPIGRFATLEDAILAVRDHDEAGGD